MHTSTYVHTDTASRKRCPCLQYCCIQDSAVDTQEVQQAFSCISSLSDSYPRIAHDVGVQNHCCCAGYNVFSRCMALCKIQCCQVPRDVRTTEVVKDHAMQLQVHYLQKAVLQLQIQAAPKHSARDKSGRRRCSKNVRSLIQADEQWAGGEVYRDELLDQLGKSVF